jgi:hypothetical protein
MLNEVQREKNYAYQKVAIGGFDTALHDWEPTPAQARRIRKKENKAKGDAPRSRRQRWLNKLRTAIEERRTIEAQAESYPDEYIVVADQDGNPLPEAQTEVTTETVGERRAARDPQSDTAREIERRRNLRERVGSHETPENKPLCPKCEPVAPDWSCRTKSGKKTRDHAGRVR